MGYAPSVLDRQCATSLNNALRMGKHTVLEIFGKKHSSASAVLKGTAGHNMWAKGKSL